MLSNFLIYLLVLFAFAVIAYSLGFRPMVYFRAVKYLVNEYGWNIEHWKEVPNIIEEKIRYEKYYTDERDRKYKEDEWNHEKRLVAEEKAARYEKEVIVLKDIIQEKNMVIDKLILEAEQDIDEIIEARKKQFEDLKK